MPNSQIKFRLKAFGWHLLAGATALLIIVGGIYLGWYRWPGWYLADATQVTRVVIGVDLVVGPLLTLVIANPGKPLRVLARDITVIAACQLIALGYGSWSLWNGRPLYYAFSEDVLQLVQPLPEGPEGEKIVQAAISGGDDVIAMPSHYKPWNEGLATLRSQLKKLDDIKYFSGNDKKRLRERMKARGLDPDQAHAMALTGRGRPLLALIDPASGEVRTILSID